MAKIWVKLNYPTRSSFSDLKEGLMITGEAPVEVEQTTAITNALDSKWLLPAEAPKEEKVSKKDEAKAEKTEVETKK